MTRTIQTEITQVVEKANHLGYALEFRYEKGKGEAYPKSVNVSGTPLNYTPGEDPAQVIAPTLQASINQHSENISFTGLTYDVNVAADVLYEIRLILGIE